MVINEKSWPLTSLNSQRKLNFLPDLCSDWDQRSLLFIPQDAGWEKSDLEKIQ